MANRYVEIADVEGRVIVLRVDYSPESIAEPGFGSDLTTEMLASYETRRTALGDPPVSSCIVVIGSDEAGSSVNRALFLLWERITTQTGGRLICANYPASYIDGLGALAMLGLERFSLAPDEATALTWLGNEM